MMNVKIWLVAGVVGMLAVLIFSVGDSMGKEGGKSGGKSRSGSSDLPRPVRHPRALSFQQWKREVRDLLADQEVKRTRLLAKKRTVDSELFLLGVEAPSRDEAVEIREKMERLAAKADPVLRKRLEEELVALVGDYDPFGREGNRVIQIDVPDEPNGRLTGFTCSAPDFEEMIRKFEDGEMMDLENLRGYQAVHAGQPLVRFTRLIEMDGG